MSQQNRDAAPMTTGHSACYALREERIDESVKQAQFEVMCAG